MLFIGRIHAHRTVRQDREQKDRQHDLDDVGVKGPERREDPETLDGRDRAQRQRPETQDRREMREETRHAELLDRLKHGLLQALVVRPDLEKEIDQIGRIDHGHDHDHRRQQRRHKVQFLAEHRDRPERPDQRRENDRHGQQHAREALVDQEGHHDQDQGNDRNENELVAVDQADEFVLFDRSPGHIKLQVRPLKIPEVILELFDKNAVRRGMLLRSFQENQDVADLPVLGNQVVQEQLVLQDIRLDFRKIALLFQRAPERRHHPDTEEFVLDVHGVRKADDALDLVIAGDRIRDVPEGLQVRFREQVARRHSDGDHLVTAIFLFVSLIIFVFRGFLDEQRFHGWVDRQTCGRDPKKEYADEHGQKDRPARMVDELRKLAKHGDYFNTKLKNGYRITDNMKRELTFWRRPSFSIWHHPSSDLDRFMFTLEPADNYDMTFRDPEMSRKNLDHRFVRPAFLRRRLDQNAQLPSRAPFHGILFGIRLYLDRNLHKLPERKAPFSNRFWILKTIFPFPLRKPGVPLIIPWGSAI